MPNITVRCTDLYDTWKPQPADDKNTDLFHDHLYRIITLSLP